MRTEDFFYRSAADRSVRSLASRMYFDELVKATGAPAHSSAQEEAALTDFRRKGFFLSYGVECPFESEGELHAALRRLAPTALKRVQYSLAAELYRADWRGYEGIDTAVWVDRLGRPIGFG